MNLTPADDGFHPPTSTEPTWAETAWFAARVTEEDLILWFYPLFRSQLGVMSCAVYVFGLGHHELWQLPYYRPFWHMPIPEDIKGACDFTLPNSLTYETLEPLQSYRLRYDDGDELTADLTFTGIHDAHPFGVQDGHGHLDQLGRVRGSLTLRGRTFAVDCIEMRDRTWSPRREARERTRLGYSYGARIDGPAFHCSTKFTSAGDPVFMTGFMLDGDTKSDLVDARREVKRDDRGRPETIRLVLTDTDGRTHEITGRVRGQMTVFTSPYCVLVSMVTWTLPDGTAVEGEDQDTWSPGRLRTFLRDNGHLPAAP